MKIRVLIKLSVLAFFVEAACAQTLNFQASYRGRFQVFRENFCRSPSPVLRAFCRGSIRVTGTDDPTIVCGTTSQVDPITGFNFIECTNSCVGAACESVYLTHSGISSSNVGEIDFTCEGNFIQDVEAYFTFVDSGDGDCDAAQADSGLNINVAQLGVECGSTFDYDELYFECNEASLALGSTSGALNCFGGASCGDGPSCAVNFDDYTVFGNLPRYVDDCVQAFNGASKELPPASNNLPVVNSVFEASWARFEDDQTQQNCSGGSPAVEIECKNGDIRLIGSSPSAVTCTGVDTSTMECTNTGPSTSINGQTSSVEYSCTGRNGAALYPETIVTFPPVDAFCDGNTEPVVVQHALQLGVECNNVFDYGTMYAECTDRGHRFESYNEFGATGSRYTCVSEASFNRNSQTSFVRTVPEVSIETDLIWGTEAPNTCWTSGVGIGEVLTLAASPTGAPVADATESPTSLPTTSPANAPFGGPDPNEPRSSDSGSSMTVILGGAIGGVVVICIAVVAIVYIKRRGAEDSTNTPKEKVEETSHHQEPSRSGSGGTGWDSGGHSYDSPGGSPRREVPPPKYRTSARSSNYGPNYADDRPRSPMPPQYGGQGEDYRQPSPVPPRYAGHDEGYRRPSSRQDYGYTGGAPPPPSPRSYHSPYARNLREDDYPDSDSYPSVPSSHATPPQQQRGSRYAIPRGSSNRSAGSNNSSGTRQLANKDQCMSVASVIQGVPVPTSVVEPPIVRAKKVGETGGDGRPYTSDRYEDGRLSRSGGGRTRRSLDP